MRKEGRGAHEVAGKRALPFSGVSERGGCGSVSCCFLLSLRYVSGKVARKATYLDASTALAQ